MRYESSFVGFLKPRPKLTFGWVQDCHSYLDSATPNNFIILQSPATIGELVTKLLLPKFERYITLEQRRQLLVRILEISLLIRPTDHTEICRDRDDNKFLNLATSGEARYLITGDNDLLISFYAFKLH